MGIFSKIHDAIFGKKEEAASAAVPADAAAASAAAPAVVAMSEADVEALLAGLAAQAGHPSNWRTSIVDLMKLVGMESSLSERKELAGELGYTGDTSDSAAMNIWLHKEVMTKLAANGGKLPAELA